jgi:hypothetical protein
LENVLVIHYENFVKQPQTHLDEMMDWLGLDKVKIDQSIHSDINKKYFDMYEEEKNDFFQYHLRGLKNIPKLYEKRLNRFGYSLSDLESVTPFDHLTNKEKNK